MDSVSLDWLTDYFHTKLDCLGTSLQLRDAIQDDTCVSHIETLRTELERLQYLTAMLSSHIKDEKTKVTQLQGFNKALSGTKERLQHTLTNLPERLPKPARDNRTENIVQECRASSQLSSNQKPSSTESTNQKKIDSSAGRPVTGKQENTYFPEIDFLTVDEFDQIPKYLKGRLNYDQINKFVEGMNKAYKSKYKLMKQKKSSMNDANRKRYETYNSQETKDTIGCYFIVEDDMKVLGMLKIDKVAQSILTILRHCGRCHEIRGGRLTRYAYVDSY